MDIYLGIDPGLKGAIAWVTSDGRAWAHRTPTLAARKGRDFFEAEMVEYLREHPVRHCVIEAVGAMPKQGVTSTFTFGMGYGLWLGMLAALGIPHERVRSQAWKKAILAGTKRDKAAAVAWCQRAYPSVVLVPKGCRVPHDGMAEAVCLSELARRRCMGVKG